MIAVTGANGQLGQLVINHLLANTAANNIVALVRNPDNAKQLSALGVQVRLADYNKPQTLLPALQGVTKLLLISGSEIGQRAAQHQAVIDAAKAVGVELFAYTSLLKAMESPMRLAQEHQETESAIAASGLPAVILRNGWYTENYTDNVAGVLATGAVAGATGGGRMNTASRDDYALAAATVLSSAESQAGKVYELAGDESYSLSEYAAEISKQTQQSIPFHQMTESDFGQLLIQIGLPEGLALVLADTEKHVEQGWLADDSHALSKLIRRPTTSLAETLKMSL